MAFDSPVFLFIFLPLVLALYNLLPRKFGNAVLFAASIPAYAWADAHSLHVLILSLIINYALGLGVGNAHAPKFRKLVFGIAIIFNLAILIIYKYLKFLIINFAALGLTGTDAVDFSGWRLPLGISFFTFAAIAYHADIYRGKSKPEINLINFGLFFCHFAKIIAGPIVRYSDMASELSIRRVTLEDFSKGVQRFVIGLAKKVLIANSVAGLTDELFKNPAGLDMPSAWLGILCYTVQIYFDFSGYSDMAIGIGRMFGFRFMENFNYPYIAQSVREFWRRWHISLSTWFRDYLYVPLGGSRSSEARTYLNLLVVFVLCGLWHGSSWNFIVWGGYHGVFLALERAGLGSALEKAWRPLRHIYMVLVVMVGWVFFRASDLTQALVYLRAMFSFSFSGIEYYYMNLVTRQIIVVVFAGIIGSTPVPALAGILRSRLEAGGHTVSRACFLNSIFVLATVVFLFVLSVMQLAINTFSPFIYAKF